MSAKSSAPATPSKEANLDNALQNYVDSITKLLEAERKALKEEREALQKEREVWQKAVVHLEATQFQDPVVLNVGGTRFAATLETLTKVPNTYFTALLSGRWDLKRSPLDGGSIFIDRDPTLFPYVINYFRDAPAQFQKRLSLLNETEHQLLQSDFEFFMLPKLPAVPRYAPQK